MNETSKTVAIIGAGTVGLAAAAHALERNLKPIVIEAGSEAAYAVCQWAHVRMFSPWEYNVDKAAGRLLAAAGWNAPDPTGYPTGGDLIVHYLEPLATRTALKDRIKTNARVIAIGRAGFDKVKSKGREAAPFEIRYQNGRGIERLKADAVIDASGTLFQPNPSGVNGLPAIGERELSQRISYGMPDVLGADQLRYIGKTVAVLGAGHSAIGTLIDLVRLQEEAPETTVVWLLRGDRPDKAFGGGANDKLAARGALGSTFAGLVAAGRLRVETSFGVSHIVEEQGRLRIAAEAACCGRHILVDELIVATGFRPDVAMLSEIRLSLDPALDCPTALAPLIDPNEHSCGTVRPHGARELAHPEAGFYIAGMKSYGEPRPSSCSPATSRSAQSSPTSRATRRQPRGSSLSCQQRAFAHARQPVMQMIATSCHLPRRSPFSVRPSLDRMRPRDAAGRTNRPNWKLRLPAVVSYCLGNSLVLLLRVSQAFVSGR